MGDAKKSVEEYLRKEGYPLEMFVAKEFKKAGYEVYQANIYIDKLTNKKRELDIVAYYPLYIGENHFNFKVVIECKFAKTPWILFSGENEGFETLQIDNFYCCNFAGAQVLNRLSIAEGFNENIWFKIKQNFSYGLTELNGDKDQEKRTTYKAVSTLLNFLEYDRTLHEKYTRKTFTITVPVIVMQGGLFECFINDEDKEEINEIDEGQLIYKSNVYPDVFPLIEVIKKENVSALAHKIKFDFMRIVNDYTEPLKLLMEKYPIDSTSS